MMSDNNNDITQVVAALQRRVDALEDENARLRQPATLHSSPPVGGTRRQMLIGGAGVLSALAGGALLGRAEPSYAAGVAPAVRTEELTPATAHTPEKSVGLQVTLTPMKTRGVLWANHEWELGPRFAGEQPPVVVATAWDDQMEHDVASFCVCAVTVHGAPGAYRATILVRNVSPFATSVVVNALALGV
jgi:hypothetical protein